MPFNVEGYTKSTIMVKSGSKYPRLSGLSMTAACDLCVLILTGIERTRLSCIACVWALRNEYVRVLKV
jgi:hypothetical protein